MLIHLLLHFASVYFFVPLAIGALLTLTASGSGRQKSIGWILFGVAAWGGVQGVPYWWHQVSMAWATKSYMDQRCEAAVEKLPPTPPVAEGVLIVRDGPSTPRVDASVLVHPGSGGFQRVQEQQTLQGKSSVTEHVWVPNRSPELGHVKRHDIAEATMPFELTIRSITTKEDQRHRVEGFLTTVVDRSNQTEVARRVQFLQFKESRYEASPRLCPPTPPEEVGCNSYSDCTPGWSLAQRALKPRIDRPASELFHLHRKMPENRTQTCNFVVALRVGPGIQPADVEWWAGGREGWEDLHLRERGAAGELVCSEFFWSGHSSAPILRFADGRQATLDMLRGQGRSRAPKPLVP